MGHGDCDLNCRITKMIMRAESPRSVDKRGRWHGNFIEGEAVVAKRPLPVWLGSLNKIPVQGGAVTTGLFARPVQDGAVTTGLFAREETRRERETLVCIRKTRDDESNLAARKRGNVLLLSTLYAQRASCTDGASSCGSDRVDRGLWRGRV